MFTLLDGEFGFPLSKDFMDPIPSAADEDSIQLVGSSGTMVVSSRQVEPLGIHKAPEAFGIYRDSFSEEKNCTNFLQYFL